MLPIPPLIASCLILGACATTTLPPATALSVENVVDPGLPPPPADPVIGWTRVEFDANGITRAEAGGYADLANRRKMTVDDPVRIASISKLVVALGVLRLTETGTLDLDEDVSTYLGWSLRNPAFPDTPITLRHLLGHRSGIRDAAGYALPLDAELEEWLTQDGAWNTEYAPGQWFSYANLNFPVVAAIMEGATGQRFDRIMQAQVFEPLGLDACFNWTTCSPEARARAVILYEPDGTAIRDTQDFIAAGCPATPASDGTCDLTTYVLARNGAAFSPQGGLRISARDLARIGQALLKGSEDFVGYRAIVEAWSPPIPLGPVSIYGDTQGGIFCYYWQGFHVVPFGPLDCHDDLFGIFMPASDHAQRAGHSGEAYGLRSGLWMAWEGRLQPGEYGTPRGVAYFATGLPEGALPGRSAFTAIEERLAQGFPIETVVPEGAESYGE